jgi:aminopeptidase-like protein
MNRIANEMYCWAEDLFPICRSITGDGVRETLQYFQKILPELKIYEVPSGTQAFDWTVPNEWNIQNAYIIDPEGNKIIDFKINNLHVVGYSTPIDTTISLEELQEHLYSLEDQPNAIPYITSYYKERWGFCLTHNQRQSLKPGNYKVKIDSTLKPGHLTYGELILKGAEEKEILLSTYVCHPSMANNELSGPVVTAALVKYLIDMPKRRYTYRILFLTETIGSIVYLSRHLTEMKKTTMAGYVLTCVGDERAYSFMPSRLGNTLADKVSHHVLKYHAPDYIKYSFLNRGSDERQYCSPQADLPVCSIMRTKYGVYPEYHTSLDDLSLISADGLFGCYEAIRKCLYILENNYNWRVTLPCEPQLGKRGLYPSLSTKKSGEEVRVMMNLIAYLDGNNDLIEVANIIGENTLDCIPIINKLAEHGLLEKVATKN